MEGSGSGYHTSGLINRVYQLTVVLQSETIKMAINASGRILVAYAATLMVASNLLLSPSNAFAFSPVATKNIIISSRCRLPMRQPLGSLSHKNNYNLISSKLNAREDDEEITMGSSALLGISGLLASTIVLYSESVLFNTGCGLPAGPFGLVGAIEGISYLGVVGLIGFSLYTKIKTGSGLPAGPGGILGAAEGVAYLAALAGILVLISQVTNYGYIPNAVPMEGGMCK